MNIFEYPLLTGLCLIPFLVGAFIQHSVGRGDQGWRGILALSLFAVAGYSSASFGGLITAVVIYVVGATVVLLFGPKKGIILAAIIAVVIGLLFLTESSFRHHDRYCLAFGAVNEDCAADLQRK